MNRTKDELLLGCIKQFEHIENVLGYNRLSSTRSLIDEINQALTIPRVVGRSEQLVCRDCKYNKAETYHDKMWCRDCRQKDRFTAK